MIEQHPVNDTKIAYKWNNRFIIGVILFGISFCVRMVYLIQSRKNPSFYVPIIDAYTYDKMARQWIASGSLTDSFFYQPFFYPFFLGIVYKLTHASIMAAKIVQAVIGAVTSVLTFYVGDMVFDRKTGLLAGLITCFYGPLVFFETELLATGLAAFWAIFLVFLICVIRDRDRPVYYFLLGLTMILAIITRPTFVPFCMILIFFLLFRMTKRSFKKVQAISRILFVALGMILIALPMLIISHKVIGNAIILPYSGGLNFYIGNNTEYADTIMIRPGLRWQRLISMPAARGITDKRQVNEFYRDLALQDIVKSPFTFVRGLIHKSVQMLTSREIPRNVDIYTMSNWSGLLHILTWKIGKFGFPFGILLPLALIGMVIFRKKLPMEIPLCILAYWASVILIFVSARYRMPMIPLLAVVGAAAVSHILTVFKQGQWKKLSAIIGMVAIISIGISLPGPFAEEKIDYQAELYYCTGTYHEKRDDLSRAIASYQKAVSLVPGYVEPNTNLGLIYMNKNQFRLAQKYLTAAANHSDGLFEPVFNLGICLLHLKQYSDAISEFKKAIKISPKSVDAYAQLANAYLKSGKLKPALINYNMALSIDPKNSVALSGLALARQQQRNFKNSESVLLVKLKQDPNNPALHTALGNIYLKKQAFEKARSCLETALQLQPDYFPALNQMAILAATQGDLAQSIDYFKKMVDLRPDQPLLYYNLACLYSRQNKANDSLTWLQKALAKGYNDWHQIETDPDLKLLRAADVFKRQEKQLQLQLKTNPQDQ